jgi:glycine cleavage system transcriptional repressor
MPKAVVSFLGADRPGVMHAVSAALTELDCNIIEVSQTILQCEFAAMLVADLPGGLDAPALQAALERSLNGWDILVSAKDYCPGAPGGEGAQPFVATLSGPDRQGLIATVTRVMADHGASIVNLKAIFQEERPGSVVLVFELAVPGQADNHAFRADLAAAAETLGIKASLQHRDIFEAMHRV